jgi:hypothetical protein
MPNYKVSLKLTFWGSLPWPFNPTPQSKRIQDAKNAADAHVVKGRNGDDLDPAKHRKVEKDGTITWHLNADSKDTVRAMLTRWRGQEVGHTFTANVTATDPEDDP